MNGKLKSFFSHISLSAQFTQTHDPGPGVQRADKAPHDVKYQKCVVPLNEDNFTFSFLSLVSPEKRKSHADKQFIPPMIL